jgi:transcription elongation factor GreB
MGRYRPPTPEASPYITRQGYTVLQQELQRLWKKRDTVRRALSAAAAEGDRSENAEYTYRKRQLGGIDRRIRYLQKRLPKLKVVTHPPGNPSQVFFGARVSLEDDDGIQSTYRIVGADELNPGKGWISIDSPMARTLLKKTIDDEVEVKTPNGKKHYTVIDIAYEDM